MGVPAFYRWLSEKYPRIVLDVIEQRPFIVGGVPVPIDLTEPNPNGLEFDNLYIDMNGLIHPCSHPEDRPPPETEEEMYHNVMLYVDRIFAAVRPRKVLYMAIDGVAPRAKMNQQRTRRFRSAGEAREKAEIKQQTREEMREMGLPVPPEELDGEWDSNVITPGTPFMWRLAEYMRFYIAQRINSNKAWQQIKVIFSDASEPGEGEHKIMDYIRRERAQAGYDPNTRHILHGLDADLIMLGLATHEAHFTILREEVLFGRRNRDKPKKSEAQERFDAMIGARTTENDNQFPFLKPFQMLHIPILREYLQEEFRCLERIPFGYDFERVIDDFVFVCFFVGNDFLPHLPSLDIRDGAIDFLYNVYKRTLPSMGDYLTAPGGHVNLEKVDIILAEVGKVEDEVFRLRRQGEEREQQRLERKVRDVERRHGGTVQEMAYRIVPEDIRALGGGNHRNNHGPPNYPPPPPPAPRPAMPSASSTKNLEVAQALRESLKAAAKAAAMKRKRQDEQQQEQSKAEEEGANGQTDGVKQEQEVNGEGGAVAEPSTEVPTEPLESPSKKVKVEGSDDEVVKGMEVVTMSTEESLTVVAMTEGDGTEAADGGAAEDEEEEDEDVPPVKDEEEEEFEKVPVVIVPPELEGTELAEATKQLNEKVKAKQQRRLDKLKQDVADTIRYHEAGWKERYYADKFKKQNMEAGGGVELMFRKYIEGLCWVFAYYYRGCQSWGWFYPFHYAPFASDLVNIERYECEFELGEPLKPMEQLMAVLPPESSAALPIPFATLMTDASSPITQFYPREVAVDPNGKAMPWLWVTLLPFIDEKLLLRTMKAVEDKLTLEEKERNSFGKALVYVHETHALAAESKKLRGGASTDGEGLEVVVLDAHNLEGFSGTLTPPPLRARIVLGQLIVAPRRPPQTFGDIENNRGLAATFDLPPPLPHSSHLLAGSMPPPPKLSRHDLAPRRPPRLGRGGINIADLGAEFGFTNIHYSSRQSMHHSINMMGPPAQTGNRSWGTLEPHNQYKAPRNHQQHQQQVPPYPMPPQQGYGPPPAMGGAPPMPYGLLPRPPSLFPGLLPPQAQGYPQAYPQAPPLFPQPPLMPLMPMQAGQPMGLLGAAPPLMPMYGQPPGGMPMMAPPLFPVPPPGYPVLRPPVGPPPNIMANLKQQVARTLQERTHEGQQGGGGGGQRRQQLQPPRGHHR